MIPSQREICEYVAAHPGCSFHEIAEGVHREWDQARRSCLKLIEQGYLQADAHTGGPVRRQVSRTTKPIVVKETKPAAACNPIPTMEYHYSVPEVAQIMHAFVYQAALERKAGA